MCAVRRPAVATRRPAGDGKRARPSRYVYGITSAATAIPAAARGVGEPAGRVRLVSHHRIAAITSAVPAGRPLGTPADLRAHANVLNSVAAVSAVLPLRFGGVLTDRGAVVHELLEPLHDEFARRLEQLAGHDQFTVKGSYVGDAALREVLMAEPGALRLRDLLRGTDPEAYREEHILLGEMVSRALDRQRMTDNDALVARLASHATAVGEATPSGPGAAVRASFLVRRTRRSRFEREAEDLGRHWDGRIRLRLLGPLAPYDFAEPATGGTYKWACLQPC